jgi:type II secretory pathway pseudopilin PulG
VSRPRAHFEAAKKLKLELQRQAAFTLPELMVVLVVTVMVIGGVFMSHLAGLQMFELSKAKLGASDEARGAIGRLVNEIRTAKLVKVGTGGLSTFTEAAVNSLQQGNALQIHATTNLNSYIRYYRDASDQKLKRTENGLAASQVIANSVTNGFPFTAEDHAGTVLTNNQNNRVIGVSMQFLQQTHPTASGGAGAYFDFYQLRTKITRRALE